MKRKQSEGARPSLRGTGSAKKIAHSAKAVQLTTPDLVLLSLLAEKPMHGYMANLELERREVQDWAGISRPQVYYSMEKLAHLGLLRAAKLRQASAGPERNAYQTTATGRAALAKALDKAEWTVQRERPPFLTWMALSWQAKPDTVQKQLQRREAFLEKELAREKETLASVLEEVGHSYHEAVWMVSLMIEQFETELRWVRRVRQENRKRGRARNPEYAGAEGG